MQQRERKNVYLIEDFSSSEEEEEEDIYNQGKKRVTRRARRLNRRTGHGAMNIFDARKRMLLESKKTPLERDNARRIANLGPGGCPACMSNPCKRVPVVNVEVGAQAVLFWHQRPESTPSEKLIRLSRSDLNLPTWVVKVS